MSKYLSYTSRAKIIEKTVQRTHIDLNTVDLQSSRSRSPRRGSKSARNRSLNDSQRVKKSSSSRYLTKVVGTLELGRPKKQDLNKTLNRDLSFELFAEGNDGQESYAERVRKKDKKINSQQREINFLKF